jgi:hypothetical protein
MIMLHVLIGFHISDPEMTRFLREGKGREAAEVDF